MDKEQKIILETRIQKLLAGELNQAATAELLAEITRDDDARRTLGEMLELQRLSRRSLGCNVDGEEIRLSLAETLDAIRVTQPAGTRKKRRNLHRLVGRVAWSARIAAMVVIAVSVYMAVTARRDSRLLQGQLAKFDPVVLPNPTTEELTSLQRLWRQVSEGSGDTKPWVLLTNGTGQFAYLPAGRHDTPRDELILMRCVIVGERGQSVMRMNLLLPPRQTVRLIVPEAGRLAGQPIRMAVSASNEWAGVGLEVGTGSDNLAGVRGRVQIGGDAVEVGQFRLNSRKMKVLLQAMTLNGKVI